MKLVAVSDLYSSSMSCGAEPQSSVIFCTMASHFLSELPTGCTMEQAEIAPAFTNGVEGWSFSNKMAMMELNGRPVAVSYTHLDVYKRQSLPKGNYHMPLTAGITMERVLNNRLALETGIQYNRLHADRTLHTLGIPVKLNVMLASTSTVDLYATVGGAAEKCIALSLIHILRR